MTDVDWSCLRRRAARRICAAAIAIAPIAAAGCYGPGTVGSGTTDGRAGTVEIKPTDLSFLEVGTERKTVERALGKPVKTHVSQGITVAVYEYDRGGIRGYSLGSVEAGLTDPSQSWVVPLAIPITHAIVRPIVRHRLRKTQLAWLCLTYLEDQSVAEIKRIFDESDLPDCTAPANSLAEPPNRPE